MERFKISKKILPFILSAMLVLTSFPISIAFAEDLPTAEVTELDASAITDVELDVAYSFKAQDDETSVASSSYKDYNADYVVKFDKAIEADTITLAGSYEGYNSGEWVSFKLPELAAGAEYRLLKDKYNDNLSYETLCTSVKEFKCGAKGIAKTPTKMTVELRLYKVESGTETGEYEVLNSDKTFEYNIPVSADYLASVDPVTEADKMEVQNPETTDVTVTNKENVTLQWSQADATIGRTVDAWWLGVKINAPEAIKGDETALKKATLKYKANGKDSFSSPVSFWDAKDSSDTASAHYSYIWVPVYEDDVKGTSNIETKLQFDWDGDDSTDQEITISLVPSKITLDYTAYYAMDSANPVISFTTASHTAWNTDDGVTVEGTVADSGTESNGVTYTSGIEKVTYAKGNGTAQNLTIASDGSFSFDVSEEYEGDYTVYAEDKAGNKSQNTIHIMHDTNDPVLANVVPDISEWTKGVVTITGNATDSMSGIDKVDFDYTAKSPEDKIEFNSTTGDFTITLKAKEFDGTITVKATDNAGRFSTKDIAVHMDNAVLCTATATPDPSAWTNGKVTVSGQFEDNTSGLEKIEFKKEADTTYETVEVSSIAIEDAATRKKGSYQFTVDAQSYEGNYNVRFTDRAGNESEVTISVNMDNVNPEFTDGTVKAVSSEWTNQDVVISGEFTDDLSGVKTVDVIKETDSTSSSASITTSDEGKSGSFTCTIAKQDYEGNYTVKATDNAGNTVETTVAVKMDITAPETPAVSYNNDKYLSYIDQIKAYFYKDTAFVTFTSSDSASGVAKFGYKLNGEGEELFIDATEGKATVEIPAQYRGKVTDVYAIDNAANKSETVNETDTVVADTIAPVLADAVFTTPDLILDGEYKSASIDDYKAASDKKIYYDNTVEATLTINEANFDIDGDEATVTPPGGTSDSKSVGSTSIKINGKNIEDVKGASISSWTKVTDSLYSVKVTLSPGEQLADGKYVITANCTDESGNAMAEYTSPEIIIDTYAPEIAKLEITTDGYYKDNYKHPTKDEPQEVKIVKPNEDNYYSYYFKNESTIVVTADDDITECGDFSGISEIKLVAYDIDAKKWVELSENKLNREMLEEGTVETGLATQEFTLSGNFKGNIYAIAVDRLGHYPTKDDSNGITSDKYPKYIDYIDGTNGIQYKDGACFVTPDDTVIESLDLHMKNSSIEITIVDAEDKKSEKARDRKIESANIDSAIDEIKADYIKDTDEKEIEVKRETGDKRDYPTNTDVKVFNKNVKVKLHVEEKYSGIRRVDYYVMGRKTQDSGKDFSGSLTIDNNGTASDSSWKLTAGKTDNLIYEADKTITVKNNSNDIIILVALTDRTGNISYDYNVVSIDKTAPVVSYKYTKGAKEAGAYKGYFNMERVLEISVKERNFEPKNIVATLENIDPAYKWVPNISNITNIKKWTSDGDKDDPTYTYKIVYAKDKDGEFKWSFNCTDIPGNKSNTVKDQFISDFTKPVVNVALTNDSVRNNRYFKDNRTANITVTDHNFSDANKKRDFVNKIKATLNGSNISIPQNSSFGGSRDSHKANIQFNADGDYVLDFEVTDMAGNKATAINYSGVSAKNFTVDKTAPKLTINNITNGKAYTDVPTITVTQEDNNCFKITSSINGQIIKLDSDQIEELSETPSGASTSTDHQRSLTATYKKVEHDGYYVISASCEDMAGNPLSISNYVITKNEFGAVYIIPDNSAIRDVKNKVVKSEAITDSDKSFIIEERIPKGVTVDEDSIEAYMNINGSKYDGYVTRKPMGEKDGWQIYQYIFSKEKFKPEGQYSLRIRSTVVVDGKDVVNNASSNDAKGTRRVTAKFEIDNTHPYVKISGLDKHRVKADEHKITLEASDKNLAYIKVTVSDGKEYVWVADVDEYMKSSAYKEGQIVASYLGEDGDLSNGFAEFILSKGTGQSISLEIADTAENFSSEESDFNYDDIFTDVRTNRADNFDIDRNKIELKNIDIDSSFVRHIPQWIKDNMQTAIAIGIAILLVIAAAIIIPILAKRRKKLDEEDEKKLDD